MMTAITIRHAHRKRRGSVEAIDRITRLRLSLAEELARRARELALQPIRRWRTWSETGLSTTDDPRMSRVIVTDEAFEELRGRLAIVAKSDTDEEEPARRLLLARLDRAVQNAVTRTGGRVWLTQTLRRHRCRIHFLRNERDVFLIACFSLDDYST